MSVLAKIHQISGLLAGINARACSAALVQGRVEHQGMGKQGLNEQALKTVENQLTHIHAEARAGLDAVAEARRLAAMQSQPAARPDFGAGPRLAVDNPHRNKRADPSPGPEAA